MRINIPVQNNVEVIIAEVFIQTAVRLHPLMPPQTTEGGLALQRIQTVLNEKVYSAINDALEQIRRLESE